VRANVRLKNEQLATLGPTKEQIIAAEAEQRRQEERKEAAAKEAERERRLYALPSDDQLPPIDDLTVSNQDADETKDEKNSDSQHACTICDDSKSLDNREMDLSGSADTNHMTSVATGSINDSCMVRADSNEDHLALDDHKKALVAASLEIYRQTILEKDEIVERPENAKSVLLDETKITDYCNDSLEEKWSEEMDRALVGYIQVSEFDFEKVSDRMEERFVNTGGVDAESCRLRWCLLDSAGTRSGSKILEPFERSQKISRRNDMPSFEGMLVLVNVLAKQS